MAVARIRNVSKLGYFSVVITVLLAALALRILDPPPIAQLRLIVFDNFQRLSPRVYDPAVPVRIVDIDEASLGRLGQWPWPRDRIAELTERLTRMGAAAIAFDMIFAEADRLSPREVFKSLPRSLIPDVMRQSLDRLPSNDTTLAGALAEAPAVLGLVLSDTAPGPLPKSIGAFASAGDDPLQFLPGFASGTGNLSELEAKAKGMGALNWVPEVDSIVRRVPIVLRGGDALFPSLAAEALRVAQGASTYIVKASGASGEFSFGQRTGIVAVRIGQLTVPTDSTGQVWIHFSPSNEKRSIPAWKIIDGSAAADEIAGRIVLIGTSAPGLFDLQSTPLEAAVPGVEAHAQAIEGVFSGELLLRPDYALGLELAFLLAASLIIIGLMRWAAVHWCLIVCLLCLAAVNGFSWMAFEKSRLLLDPVYPSIALISIFVCGELNLFFATERERRFIRGAFSRYLSPDLVAKLGDKREGLQLGGEIRNMTLLFCDIRGFTQISEGLSAAELTTLINRFLTPMTEAILENHGTIDKYMGDAIMAFWNAPLDDPNHPDNACRAARAMLTKLNGLNAELHAEAQAQGRKFIPIRIGIGINTGEACVGNMGSAHRFDYSVIGDNVNIASRLEGQSKTYGVPIVVGEATAEAAPDWPMIELDMIRVKGKTKAERIFTILPASGEVQTYDVGALQENQLSMLKAYRGQHWRDALALLDTCRGFAPQEAVGYYDRLAQRIDLYLTDPPEPGWDGAYEAETK